MYPKFEANIEFAEGFSPGENKPKKLQECAGSSDMCPYYLLFYFLGFNLKCPELLFDKWRMYHAHL